MENKKKLSKSSYVYTVELLIEDADHKKALEQLIAKLNKGDFPDYRILSGIQLGQEIQSRIEKLPGSVPVPVMDEPIPPKGSFDGWETLRSLLSSKRLVRLIVNKGLGVRLSLSCRIINLDEQGGIVTIYHVDEKQVYTFLLTEIEEIIE